MNIITFDIEDWFHLLNVDRYNKITSWNELDERVTMNTLYILDELDKFNVKGIFFCLGWIAEKYPDLIKEIELRGHLIGTHSYAHQLVFKQTEYQFEKDLDKSINILKKIVKQDIKFYRAPGFSIKKLDTYLLKILFKLGIKFDSSIFPGLRFHGGMRSNTNNQPFKIVNDQISITELPISYVKLLNLKTFYSGGGYFRLLNIEIIKKLSSLNDYNMFYFHPRDFDFNQPRIKSNPLSYFRNYVGLKNSKYKFENLLKNIIFDEFTENKFNNIK